MFKPNFKYNNKIVRLLTKISAAREVILNSPLVPKWLEYFIEGVNVSINKVEERVVKLSSKRLRKTKKGQIALTERQMKIVEFINQKEQIKNKDVREMFKISDEGALKEIKKLIKSGVIKNEGKGRSLHYALS